MIPLFLMSVAFLLMAVPIIGNAQPSSKKLPIEVVRNNSHSKETDTESSSQPTARPSTAIDPLSHVCFPGGFYPFGVRNLLQLLHAWPV